MLYCNKVIKIYFILCYIKVVRLSNHSYKPITNTAWVRAQLCKLQKGCTQLAATSDKVYQFLAHGRWFSPASSNTKTGRHDIAEILLKVALNTINQIKSHYYINLKYYFKLIKKYYFKLIKNIMSSELEILFN